MNSSNKRPEQKSSNARTGINAVSMNAVERRLIPRAFPIPEVIEGSESSDWALWEEAVASQGGPAESTIDSKIAEDFPDPFASVRKHRGVL